MSCASTFSHSLIPRYTMVTAQFEQFERHQQTGARTDKEPHAPTCDVKELFDYQGSFERDRTGAKQRSGNSGLANRPIIRNNATLVEGPRSGSKLNGL